ncbi:helix-turn-helix transcriptional regulator [Arthrobacter sp. Y-9]|uniref:helix-turn-helix domain-containing protein n=1 Tax=Arthrobacter sp. Y-9 TaxID=3039385 RepID=UPI00241BF5BC|nr:helix-turn-helix transcriptional regulator [Arthrobacter sp. Y-9]WFR84649.1 helix-turn-helix transcriptional regulator [Arthrobacter sp. Y-9]
MKNPGTPDELFGLAVKQLRENEGWTMSELATRLSDAGLTNFHPTTVARMERGERPVRLSEAVVIARLFDVGVDDLVAETRSEVMELEEYIASLKSAHKLAGRWLHSVEFYSGLLRDLASRLERDLAEGQVIPEDAEAIQEGCDQARAILSGPDLTQQWLERIREMSEEEFWEFVTTDYELQPGWVTPTDRDMIVSAVARLKNAAAGQVERGSETDG